MGCGQSRCRDIELVITLIEKHDEITHVLIVAQARAQSERILPEYHRKHARACVKSSGNNASDSWNKQTKILGDSKTLNMVGLTSYRIDEGEKRNYK